MAKLCILIDPNHVEGSRAIFDVCCKVKGEIEEKCEFWVGCSSSQFNLLNHWLKALKDKGFNNRFCFAGRFDHVFSGIHANYLLRPDILNHQSNSVVILSKMGKVITNFSYKLSETEMLDYGYLVLDRGTSVGDKINARCLHDGAAYELVKRYVDNKRDCYGVYIEAGSGSKEPVSQRAYLVKRIDGLLGEKILMAGGGIQRVGEVETLIESGVDRVVVSTHFEKRPEDIPLFASVF